MARRAQFLLLFPALLLGLNCSPVLTRAEEPPGSSSKPESPASPGKDAAKPAEQPKVEGVPTDCMALLEKIRTLANGIPVIFVDIKRPLNQINEDMVQCSTLCQQFLKQCDGTADAAEVRATLARMELARLARWQQELNDKPLSPEGKEQAFKTHVAELIETARRALKDAAPGSKTRTTALRVLIDLNNRASRFDEVPPLAEQLLKEFPLYEHRPSVHLAVAGALLSSARCAEAVTYLQSVLKEHSEDPEYVHYNDKLFDALTCVGDLEGMEDLIQLMRAEYPSRIPLLKEGHYVRNQYEQWLCMSLFWVGFIKMARGDVEDARKTFHEHVAEYGARVERMKKEGKSPGSNDICTITLDYRTMDMLEVLDKFYGKVPTTCFNLDNFWVSEKKLNWDACKGKIVVAVFRAPGDTRAAKFLQELDSLVKLHEKDGLLGITLAHMAGRPNPSADARAMQNLREDLKQLKVSLPAGYDPDHEGQKLFREVHATVGTASVVVFNRKGEIAWFLADPRDLDRAILRRVVERMLAEKPEKAK